MIRINEIALSLDEDESLLKKKAAKILKINEKYIKKYTIYKKSIDARKKDDVHFTYSLDVNISLDEEQIASKCKSNKVQIVKPYVYELPENKRVSKFRPVVVGFGPAGMFAGLILALSGLKPIILERGKDVEARKADAQKFWREKKLNEESNVQFGEGGAGTFSDGKLTTGIKSPFIKKILEELYEAGAPEEILYSSKPHIGTDRLEIVVKNIRKKIESLGGEVKLECKLTRLIVANKFVHGVTYEHKGESIDLETDTVIMAIGHSARDTFETLYRKQVPMEAKSFAVGVRIEHPQEMINRSQYGRPEVKELGAANYKLTHQLENGRGIYSFCMCPGGFVVPAASGPEQIVVNGMSPSNRGSVWANSGMVVELQPEDFGARFSMFGVLAGIKFQEDLERQCYLNGNCKQTAPAQRMTDFVNRRNSFDLPRSSYSPGLIASPLHFWLPDFIAARLQEGFKYFGKVSHGFLTREAVMIGVETRTSSPVRIPRDRESMTHIRLRGFYPCGEGAGYAGGIVSAAIDGERCAEALAMQIKQSSSFDRSV